MYGEPMWGEVEYGDIISLFLTIGMATGDIFFIVAAGEIYLNGCF
jgi:hypothetical protein